MDMGLDWVMTSSEVTKAVWPVMTDMPASCEPGMTMERRARFPMVEREDCIHATGGARATGRAAKADQ